MKNIKNIVIIALVIIVGYLGYKITQKTQAGQEEVKITQEEPTPVLTIQPTPPLIKTLGEFLVTNDEVCTQGEKPIIYLFGSTGCPHCVWEKPVMKKVIDKFGNGIVYHENIDSQNDSEIFTKYQNINPQGLIPFLVFGCKYVRTGSGENLGLAKEEENLTALICKLTNSKPESVCSPLKDQISNIQ